MRGLSILAACGLIAWTSPVLAAPVVLGTTLGEVKDKCEGKTKKRGQKCGNKLLLRVQGHRLHGDHFAHEEDRSHTHAK